MDFMRDFWYGFSKPLRDFAGALLMYLIVTTYPSLLNVSPISPTQKQTILLIVSFFIVISLVDDGISEAVAQTTRGYYDPIDASARILGICLGTMVLGVFLLPAYAIIGGDVSDLIVPGIIAVFFLGLGTAIRLLSPRMRLY
jgi:hypothetical protein